MNCRTQLSQLSHDAAKDVWVKQARVDCVRRHITHALAARTWLDTVGSSTPSGAYRSATTSGLPVCRAQNRSKHKASWGTPVSTGRSEDF
jgi:hypothetical protein